jgi:hypothetical protein
MENKKCQKKFLFFKWVEHDFELVDIKENVKTIGEKCGEWEAGIYVRKFKTLRIYKCKKCGKKKTETETKEETVRQYY